MKPADVSEVLGKRFGRLQAVAPGGRNAYGHTLITCQCDCGATTVATFSHLRKGQRTSCGCATKGPVTHGMSSTKVYGIWCGMISRCHNPGTRGYRFYGAKGVSVCDKWRESFENFYADMGDPPEGLTIDRIDPKGPYEPGNCRWATTQQQIENRTCQVMYEYEGRSYTLPTLCTLLGINYRTMINRLRRTGMTLSDAINHRLGEITESGMSKLKAAVTESNIRRGFK